MNVMVSSVVDYHVPNSHCHYSQSNPNFPCRKDQVFYGTFYVKFHRLFAFTVKVASRVV